jgi:hypothetical protein
VSVYGKRPPFAQRVDGVWRACSSAVRASGKQIRGMLSARIRVALRHAARLSVADEPVRHFDDLMIDLARRLVSVGGQELHLTPKEYELLRAFVLQAGKVLTHRMLLRAVWVSTYEQDVPPNIGASNDNLG